MIILDGSMYEGGGAIIRVAVGLSAICKKPIKITNIRAKRCNPGLRPQHLNAVLAVAKLCNAETNAEIACKEMEFFPKELEFKDMNINIGTAGSIPLVIYSLLIPCSIAQEKFKIKIIGGTDTKMAPPIDYTKNVLIENLKKFGLNIDLEVKKRGYYPKGGGEVETTFYPSKIKEIVLTDSGKLLEIKGISHASEYLKKAKVAERQAKAAGKVLAGYNAPIKIKPVYEKTLCPGSGINLCAVTENSILGGNSLGELGKPSEKVGKEAAEMLIKELDSKSPVDIHLSDQLIPFLALFGGEIKTSKISSHTQTNMWVCEQFFGKIFEVGDGIIKVKYKYP